MMDDLEERMKQKILEGLRDHMMDRMGDGMAEKFPKKAMEVSVMAPDKEHLSEGLGKAKEMAEGEHGDDSDEDRLMAMMGDHDEDDEDA